MAEIAEGNGLDLVHCHYAIPHSVSAFLAKSMLEPRKLPIVTTLHGTDITLVGADRSYLPITRYGLQQSDGVTAVSRFLKQATIETFDFDEIEVIPNFICPTHYQRLEDAPLRDELAPNGEKLLVHVSNFRVVKRPLDCIEILARVRKKGVNAKLLMVGDGPERAACDYRAKQLEISEYAEFVGKRENIADYLGIADVFLLPSELESFGLAALEAQACEVPVVASRIGGIPEVVTDNETGFLSDIGNVEKMSEDVFRLLSDEAMRREFGRQARESAVSRYSTEKIIPQYIAFYEKILGAKTNPAEAEQ
jgi:N-acetyl-alpha-D-glucosaminyl L-malate synthase BshA